MVVISIASNVRSQDHIISSFTDFYCGDISDTPPPGVQWPYFLMNDDTLKVLVVFCNFPSPGGNWDPPGSLSTYTQHWPGSSGQTKPSWADSIICPTTTNVWDNSLTGLFRDMSGGKFWLIGDVYPELYVFENDFEYYSPANGRRIGDAIKELLENIDGEVDFSEYDRLDPEDLDSNGNRREPDGRVDFIFINFRFNISHVTDPDCYPCANPKGYSGIAKLGGHNSNFGSGIPSLTLDGVEILARHPGSGAIYEMWTPRHLGVPTHEFGEHYGHGPVHHSGLGAFNIQGGALASADDREHINWNFGTHYTPTSNTSITLRDYITSGDYAKIQRSGHTLFLENRRRISYYASEQYKSWHWLASEPLYPHHPDSGLLIYRKTGSLTYLTESANGRWNWQNCSGTHYKCNWSTNTFNIWFQDNLNRYNGESTFNLYNKFIKDQNCNTISTATGEVNYRGVGGDSNTCFDVGYNEVYSPWSNPPLPVAGTSDSLTVEIAGKDEYGDMIVNIYFTNITQAKPSKPQYLKLSQHFTTPQETIFNPQLDWEPNLEPDHDYYKIYRGAITTPGVDPTYYYIGYTRDTTFIDENVDLYVAQGGSGVCTYQYKAYSYRITAIDEQELESVKSEKDTIWGYSDPCAPEDNLIENNPNVELEYGLVQNYPNPFNPKTIISYSLKEQSFVSLKVFNILGQEIDRLVYGLKDKGNYSVAFNAENKNLSSGIYYYLLEVKNGNNIIFSEVKRMVLIK